MATGSRDPYYNTKSMWLYMWAERKTQEIKDTYQSALEKGENVQKSLEDLGERLER